MLDFIFCPQCNARVDMMLADLSIPKHPESDLKRQWLEALGTDWPCEVTWHSGLIELLYFSEIDYYDFKPIFVRSKYKFEPRCNPKNFYPLGTPLDYLKLYDYEISKIIIYSDNDCQFIFKNGEFSKIRDWPNCPEGILGTTLKIPEDWRIK